MFMTGSQVSCSPYAGVRAVGNVCQFLVFVDAFASITGAPVSVLSQGCTPSSADFRVQAGHGREPETVRGTTPAIRSNEAGLPPRDGSLRAIEHVQCLED